MALDPRNVTSGHDTGVVPPRYMQRIALRDSGRGPRSRAFGSRSSNTAAVRCVPSVIALDRKVAERAPAGSRSGARPAKMLALSALEQPEPYQPRKREAPARGAAHNRIPARSDPSPAAKPSPGPEQKANNRGHDNRPRG